MIIELLGWFSTLIVLIGFVCNAITKPKLAMLLWIIGDVGWITYDLLIDNYSHMSLSTVIIIINVIGIYKIIKNKNNEISK